MALSGLHVLCAFAGPSSPKGTPVMLPSNMQWSQTMATGATTTKSAPAQPNEYGGVIFEVTASADVYVSIGPAPDASTSPRAFVPASTVTDFVVKSGDKLNWQLA